MHNYKSHIPVVFFTAGLLIGILLGFLFNPSTKDIDSIPDTPSFKIGKKLETGNYIYRENKECYQALSRILVWGRKYYPEVYDEVKTTILLMKIEGVPVCKIVDFIEEGAGLEELQEIEDDE